MPSAGQLSAGAFGEAAGRHCFDKQTQLIVIFIFNTLTINFFFIIDRFAMVIQDLIFGMCHVLLDIFINSGLLLDVFCDVFLGNDVHVVQAFHTFIQRTEILVMIFTTTDIVSNVFHQKFLTNEEVDVAFRAAIVIRFREDLNKILVEDNGEYFPVHVMQSLQVDRFIETNALAVLNNLSDYGYSYKRLLVITVTFIFNWLFQQSMLDNFVDLTFDQNIDNLIAHTLDFDMDNEWNRDAWIHPSIASPLAYMEYAIQLERWLRLESFDHMDEYEIETWIAAELINNNNADDDDDEDDGNDDDDDDDDDEDDGNDDDDDDDEDDDESL